jgi:acetyltransferase-like isoleucine patch superfamily enzyme
MEYKMDSNFKDFIKLYQMCKKSDSNFIYVIFMYIYYKILYRRDLFLHQKVSIKGIGNLEQKGKLFVGVNSVGFMHKNDITYININGKLKLSGNYSIGRGCRFDIGKNGVVSLGKGGYITANSTFIIMHDLTIGDNCVISWNCLFLDDDMHEINYQGKKNNVKSITIGNNVWIGCGVKIYKGTVIPNNTIIASDSSVKGIFTQEYSLIGGNPAKVLKENVYWK